MHCSAEVTESSTNKQHHLSEYWILARRITRLEFGAAAYFWPRRRDSHSDLFVPGNPPQRSDVDLIVRTARAALGRPPAEQLLGKGPPQNNYFRVRTTGEIFIWTHLKWQFSSVQFSSVQVKKICTLPVVRSVQFSSGQKKGVAFFGPA